MTTKPLLREKTYILDIFQNLILIRYILVSKNCYFLKLGYANLNRINLCSTFCSQIDRPFLIGYQE